MKRSLYIFRLADFFLFQGHYFFVYSRWMRDDKDGRNYTEGYFGSFLLKKCHRHVQRQTKHMSKMNCRNIPLNHPLVPTTGWTKLSYFIPVSWIRIRIRMVHIDFGLLDPDPDGQMGKMKRWKGVKCWMYSFEYKHLVLLGRPSWESVDFWREKNIQPYNFTCLGQQISESGNEWSESALT